MAVDGSREGLRSAIITSLYGRRTGFDKDDFLIGGKGGRMDISGFTSGASTLVSTSVSVNLPNYGMSVVGATGASGTTAYVLDNPRTGCYKVIFNPTTGLANINTGNSFVCSTGSAASTHQNFSFNGKGAIVELVGLTTGLWALLTPISTASTNQPVSIS